ncbi:hypothetical protein NQ314_010064, partial [Rhamnusium bicolor]
LYTSNEEISSVNNLRGILAASKTLEKLPPTEYRIQHCLRAHYQTIIWLNAFNPVINPPNVLEYGWQLINGKLVPLFQTVPPFPQDLAILTYTAADVKKIVNISGVAVKKNKIPCIGSCRCMGQKSCSNVSSNENNIEIIEENMSFKDESGEDLE